MENIDSELARPFKEARFQLFFEASGRQALDLELRRRFNQVAFKGT